MKKHLKLRIRGRVQRVSYRANTRNKALQLGVQGFVQNMPDSSVYAEVEGTPEVLDQFVEWCRQGPSLARVDEIEIREDAVQGFSGFEIRYPS